MYKEWRIQLWNLALDGRIVSTTSNHSQGQDSIHTLHMYCIYNGVYTVHTYVCLQGHCCFSTHTDATASEVMQHTPCTLMQWSLYIHTLHTVLCTCAQILAISGIICVQVVDCTALQTRVWSLTIINARVSPPRG